MSKFGDYISAASVRIKKAKAYKKVKKKRAVVFKPKIDNKLGVFTKAKSVTKSYVSYMKDLSSEKWVEHINRDII